MKTSRDGLKRIVRRYKIERNMLLRKIKSNSNNPRNVESIVKGILSPKFSPKDKPALYYSCQFSKVYQSHLIIYRF